MQNADKQCAMLNVATDEVTGSECVWREGGRGCGKYVLVWQGGEREWVVTRPVHIFSRQLHSFIHPYTLPLSLALIQYTVSHSFVSFVDSFRIQLAIRLKHFACLTQLSSLFSAILIIMNACNCICNCCAAPRLVCPQLATGNFASFAFS